MATVNIYEMAQTWNNGAVAFTAIGMNVTDTASDAASLLMDLQVGGSSKFRVDKSGNALVAAEAYVGANINSRTLYRAGSEVQVHYGGRSVIFSGVEPFFGGGGAQGIRANYFRFGHSTSTYVYGGANNILEQRNGANAQTFNIYNTYTDASNYERGFMKWNSNVLEIGTESAGTGTNRELYLRTANVFTLVVGGSFLLHAPAASRLSLHNGVHLQWSSTTSAKGSPDTGILRDNAGVVKVTDGSTGTGELIFIVPTSDPGITGALWNNGGTLAISA